MTGIIEQLEKALELACRYIAEDIYCPYDRFVQQNCTKNCETEGGPKCCKEFFLKRAVNSDEKMG